MSHFPISTRLCAVNMRMEISELHQKLETTMIYVTHDQVEAMTMADKIVVLQAGVIEQVGTPARTLPRPCNRVCCWLHRLAENEFHRRGRSGKTQGAQHWYSPRAHHCFDQNSEGSWKGTVGVAEHLGSDTFLHIHGLEGCDPMTVRAGGEVCRQAWRYGVSQRRKPIKIHRFDDDGSAHCMKRLGGKSASDHRCGSGNR